MSQSAIAAALAAHDHEALRAAIYSELSPTIAADVDPRTWDERELGALGGNCWPKVTWQDREWYRDADDGETDHDGLTTIVTLGGSRYKTNDVRFDPRSVISRSLDTPPEDDGSPPLQYGETWLVPDGASGDWAGHEDEFAMWTARGWRFKPAVHGEITLVDDEGEAGQFVHFNTNDEWADGLPGNVVELSVRPSHLLIRSWAFENQTTTTPPASGPAGEQYVIGAGATDAWAGHDKKIAWRPATDAAFCVSSPFVGEEGYDKELKIKVRWDGLAWQSSVGVWIGFSRPAVDISGTIASFGGTDEPISVPPQVTFYNSADVSLTHVSKNAGNTLRFKYRAAVSWGGVNGGFSTGLRDNAYLALFRDSESLPIAYRLIGTISGGLPSKVDEEFILESSDGFSHDYRFRIMQPVSEGGGTDTLYRASMSDRIFTIEEGVG